MFVHSAKLNLYACRGVDVSAFCSSSLFSYVNTFNLYGSDVNSTCCVKSVERIGVVRKNQFNVRRRLNRIASVLNSSREPAIPDPDIPKDAEANQIVDSDDDVGSDLRGEIVDRVNVDIDSVLGAAPPPIRTSVSCEVAGQTVAFESGQLARQADGSVAVRVGDSMVLCTACSSTELNANVDFLPLRVDYQEKLSAAGRTAGSYIKREGRPSQHEILVSRLIDRPLRPMIQDGYFHEVQLLSNVLSFDKINVMDTWAICGCAAALHVSSVPLVKAVAAVRVVMIGQEWVVNPSSTQLYGVNGDPSISEELVSTEIVIAGTADAILMIEGACGVISEEKVLEAVEIAQQEIKSICAAMDKLKEKVGKEKRAVALRIVSKDLFDQVDALCEGLDAAVKTIGKESRAKAVDVIRERIYSQLQPTNAETQADPVAAEEKRTLVAMAWKKVISKHMRDVITSTNVRPDGRDCVSVRPIWIEPSFLPTTHGSVLFTRGETQTLAVCTLGGEDSAQRFEALTGDGAERFYLQYMFPPFSVGEVGRVGAPGRREIGHGKLAERSLRPVIPSRDEFPYVIRLESNILESNGSSSMASVCGGCLAMMDAGVPVKAAVAGIAMGLILSKNGTATILSDILGMEDALGDMDFKVAGSREGITGLQMDIKVEGITMDILRTALSQAHAGRMHILDKMTEALPEARESLPASVPRIRTMMIPPSKIGEVIGPGGKKIRSIVEECGGEEAISLNIENDGTVSFSSHDLSKIEKAMEMVKSIVIELNVGDRFKVKVSKLLPFGAYVDLLPGKEGWLHISEVAIERTEKVEDALAEGQEIEVEIIDRGRNQNQFRVSRKAVLMKDLGLTNQDLLDMVAANALAVAASSNSDTSSVSDDSSEFSSSTPYPKSRKPRDSPPRRRTERSNRQTQDPKSPK